MKTSNKAGTAGLILALVTVFLYILYVNIDIGNDAIIPVIVFYLFKISPITWLAGLVLSIIGMFKRPRGHAIAGLAISLGGLILVILFIVFMSLVTISF